jgi:hypothetical protein
VANYNKATNFTVKDGLAPGDPGKIVKGTEIDIELNAIASAISTKADTNNPTFTGTPTAPTATSTTNNTQIATTAFVQNILTPVISGLIPSGTKMLFQQTTAPTGWTKDTTHNNKALRVVTGTASAGGTVEFTSAFTTKAVSGTVANTTLTTAQMPLHGHPWINGGGGDANAVSGPFTCRADVTAQRAAYTGTPNTNAGQNLGGQGGGQAHTHGFTGSAIDLAVQYVDLIIATKN